MLYIKNYDRNKDIKIPFEGRTIIIGDNYREKYLIKKSLSKFFSRKKLTQEESEYLDEEKIEVVINESKVTNKEFSIIVVDELLDINSEIKLSKSSQFRNFVDIQLQSVFELEPNLDFLNDIMFELVNSKYALEINEILDKCSSGDISFKMNIKNIQREVLMDYMIDFYFCKNEIKIPVDYMSFYEKLMWYLNFIEYYICKFDIAKKYLIIFDHIDKLMSAEETQKVYEFINKFNKVGRINIIILADNTKNMNMKLNIEEILLLNMDKTVLITDYTEFLKEIELEHPKFIDLNEIMEITNDNIMKKAMLKEKEIENYNEKYEIISKIIDKIVK